MIRVGIVGGTGYTGVELLRLLALHPEVEIGAITSRGEAGTPVAEMFPNLRGHVDLSFTEPDVAQLGACDLVFFATPNGTAMQMVPQLLDAGTRVIDLAADTLACNGFKGLHCLQFQFLLFSQSNISCSNCVPFNLIPGFKIYGIRTATETIIFH